jgi:hypothetical protein
MIIHYTIDEYVTTVCGLSRDGGMNNIHRMTRFPVEDESGEMCPHCLATDVWQLHNVLLHVKYEKDLSKWDTRYA